MPVVLAKLWSVIPRLFVWPPARSVAHALERATLLMLVGGILFEIVTGLMNIQYDYAFGFSFYTAHYIGAWVFLAGFVAHVALKLPVARRALRTRSLRAELRVPPRRPCRSRPIDGLVATDPAPPTMSRRGALALVGGVRCSSRRSPPGRRSAARCATSRLLLPAAAARTSRSTGPPPRLPSAGRHRRGWRLRGGPRS